MAIVFIQQILALAFGLIQQPFSFEFETIYHQFPILAQSMCAWPFHTLTHCLVATQFSMLLAHMVTIHSLNLEPIIETCAHIDNFVLVTCCEAHTWSHIMSLNKQNPSMQHFNKLMPWWNYYPLLVNHGF